MIFKFECRYRLVFGPFTGIDNHKKCVTFAAGLLSKEDVEHYVWLFEAFMEAMGREPVVVITDQCPSMLQAIPKVFRNAKHRLWMLLFGMKTLSQMNLKLIGWK